MKLILASLEAFLIASDEALHSSTKS